MRIARDFEGNLYDSYANGVIIKEDLKVRKTNFFCPNCGKPVVLRSKINTTDNKITYHFSHLGGKGCSDTWEEDTSGWCREMGRCFRGKVVERWVSNSNGEKHRADVIVGNIVIMFKSKDIDPEEFKNRTNFFTNLGYDLAWIIGETRSWNSSRFTPSKSYQEYYGDMMIDWSCPKKMLSGCPRIANTCSWVNGQRVSICIGYVSEDIKYVNKVLWVKGSENDDGILDWSKFRINTTCTYTMNEVVRDPNILFLSPKEYIEDYVKKFNIPYKERYKGVERKGAAINDYKCPKSNHSLQVDECKKCSNCLGVDMFHADDSKLADRVFCAYPKKSGQTDIYGFAKVKRVAR